MPRRAPGKNTTARIPTVERNIYFFRSDIGSDEEGMPFEYQYQPTLRHLNDLTDFSDTGRYLKDEDDNVHCAWVDDAGTLAKVRFALIRRNGLPMLERGGTLNDLNIPQDAGLAETIHVVFFPDNIVGCDFNFYGPRMSRLAEYLTVKSQGLSNGLRFEPLVRNNMADQIRTITEIKMLHLKVRRSYFSAIRSASTSLADALEAQASLSHADSVELILRTKPHSGSALSNGLQRIVSRLVSRTDYHAEYNTLRVKGTNPNTGGTEVFDLLKDQFISQKKILKHAPRSRSLNPTSAYDAIQQAYREQRDELVRAASLIS